ncbi:MAG: tetratricopeptide repeat protein [Acidobacteria bacterium]|nr:tetratricopeptide repeat protein [Acidobacteriota bacterium]
MDKGKIIKKAEKLVKQGKLENAVQEYLKVLKDNPNDWAVVNIVGDLLVRLEKKEEAVTYFKKLADHYEKDGFYLKAIAIYKKIVKLMPNSLPDCLKLAQLYVEQGLPMEAKSYYMKVAQDYLSLGKSSEALEIYQKLVNIDPSDVHLKLKLAELYQKEKNPARAVADLIALGDKALEEGRIAEARMVFKKILDIQPKNPDATFKLAEIYCREGMNEKALALFGTLIQDDPDNVKLLAGMGDIYLRMGRLREAREVFERVTQLKPDDVMAKLQLGLVALEEGDVDKAFELMEPAIDEKLGKLEYDKVKIYLSQLLKKNERHAPTLEKLVKLYTVTSDVASLVKTLKVLSEIYLEKGDYHRAFPVLERLCELDPDNEEYGKKLHLIRAELSKEREEGETGSEGTMVEEKEEVEEEEEIAEEKEVKKPEAAQPPISGMALREFTKEEQQQINNAVVEAEIFIKYGLIDKAVDKITSLFPDCYHSLPLHETLKKAYLEKKDYEQAAKEYAILVRLHQLKGEEDKAKAEEKEARDTIPEASLFDKALEELKVLAPPIEPDMLVEEEDRVPFVDGMTSVERSHSYLTPPPVAKEERKGREEPVLASLPEEEKQLTPLVSSTEKKEAGVKTATPPPKPEPVSQAGTPVEEEAGLVSVSEKLLERLEEVDFYIDQGFPRNAKELLKKLYYQFPDNPEVLSRMSRVGLDPASLPQLEEIEEEKPTPFTAEVERGLANAFERYEPSSPVGTSEGKVIASESDLFAEEESFFNLSQELGEDFLEGVIPSPELSAQDEEVEKEELISEIKGEIGKSITEEDYQTHYNLGIAYKEMKLIDEAIGEFQVSLKSEALYIESCSMLGICFMEKGMPEIAIKWFEKGLEKATGKEKEGLLYYLAQAYELTGDIKKALEIYRELFNLNPQFQDVAQRIRNLER